MGMISGLIALFLLVGLAAGPLLWRVRQDRQQARAEAVRADTNAALFHAFEGESLVSVEVEPPAFRHPGRVILSAPSDWQGLLAEAWPQVAPLVPADYELVVRSTAPAFAPGAHALPRAA
jgi:hypothetical protein